MTFSNAFALDIHLKIIIADEYINFHIAGQNLQELIKRKVEVRITRFPHLMHHKFCIVDERLLITGSYNWTLNAETRNHENIIITNEITLLNQFAEEFEALSKSSERVKKIEPKLFREYLPKETERHVYDVVTDAMEIDNTEPDSQSEDRIPDEIFDLFDDADLLYLTGKYDQALEICNQISLSSPGFADVYELMARCKWRQNKPKEQIFLAQKAIDLNNEMYDAYNILGIGYAELKNAQKSIENYEICILADPNCYAYYKNRAISYAELEEDFNVPKKLRDQFAVKAKKDLNTIINITDMEEKNNQPYELYYSRGFAKLFLEQLYEARTDLLKAKEIYEATPKNERDVHDYKEIKQHLRNLDTR